LPREYASCGSNLLDGPEGAHLVAYPISRARDRSTFSPGAGNLEQAPAGSAPRPKLAEIKNAFRLIEVGREPARMIIGRRRPMTAEMGRGFTSPMAANGDGAIARWEMPANANSAVRRPQGAGMRSRTRGAANASKNQGVGRNRLPDPRPR